MGGYDTAYMAPGKTSADIRWAHMFTGNPEAWSIPAPQILVNDGPTSVQANANPSETYVIADSGTTFALIPADDYDLLL